MSRRANILNFDEARNRTSKKDNSSSGPNNARSRQSRQASSVLGTSARDSRNTVDSRSGRPQNPDPNRSQRDTRVRAARRAPQQRVATNNHTFAGQSRTAPRFVAQNGDSKRTSRSQKTKSSRFSRAQGKTPARSATSVPVRPVGNAPVRPIGSVPARPAGNAPARPARSYENGARTNRNSRTSASRPQTMLYARHAAPAHGRPSEQPRSGSRSAEQERQRREEERRRTNQKQRQKAKEPTFTDKLTKKTRSIKAERQFEKNVGSEEAKKEPSSRAAVYKYDMGKNQQRAVKLQNGPSSASGFSKKKSSKGPLPQRIIRSKFTLVACVAIFCCVMIYQPLADYYQETRKVQQLEAEYAALQDHNQNLQSEIAYLQTDAGKEDYARTQYGLIGANENQVVVENVTPSKSSTAATDATHTVLTAGVDTPSTWYSGVLDVVFGYSD